MFFERFSKMFKKNENQDDIKEVKNAVSDDGEKRFDNKGRVLQIGESQTSDGRYRYRYTDKNGKRHAVYAWRLIESDETPYGKKRDKCLREKERDVLGEKLDGEKRFLYQVIDKNGLISNVYTVDGEHLIEELDLHLLEESLHGSVDYEGPERIPTKIETPKNSKKIRVSYNSETDSLNFSTESTRRLESEYAKMLIDSKNKNIIKIVACDMSDKSAHRWQRPEYVNGDKGKCRTWTSKKYIDIFKKCAGMKNTNKNGIFYFYGDYNSSDNSLVFDLSKAEYKGGRKESKALAPPRLVFDSVRKSIRLNLPASRIIDAKYITYSLGQNNNELLFMKGKQTIPQSIKVNKRYGSRSKNSSVIAVMENCDTVKRSKENGIFYFEVYKKGKYYISFDLSKGYLAESKEQQQIFIDL